MLHDGFSAGKIISRPKRRQTARSGGSRCPASNVAVARTHGGSRGFNSVRSLRQVSTDGHQSFPGSGDLPQSPAKVGAV